MELYEKIKEFAAINPAPMHLGTYLKQSKKVCEIYYALASLEGVENFEEAEKRENELNSEMTEILNHWRK